MYQTWEEIKKRYPSHWVVLLDITYSSPPYHEVTGGVVYASSEDKDELLGRVKLIDLGGGGVFHTQWEEGDNGYIASACRFD